MVISEQRGHTPLEWNLRTLKNKTHMCDEMRNGLLTQSPINTCINTPPPHTHYKASFLLLSYFTTCEKSEVHDDAWEILGQSSFRRAGDKKA